MNPHQMISDDQLVQVENSQDESSPRSGMKER